MRASSRGTVVSASASIAVQGTRSRASALTRSLTVAGFELHIDDHLSPGPSGATVMHVEDRSGRLDEQTSFACRVRQRLAGGAFQPVWAIYPAMRSIELELLVVDDTDATEQLDLIYPALRGEHLHPWTKRSHITIKPSGGWQRYPAGGPSGLRGRP